MSRVVSKIAVVYMVLALFNGVWLPYVSQAASEDLQLNLYKNKPIDIVLTVGETDQSLTNFERDIKNKLRSKGVDTSKVNVEAIETTTTSTNDADASEVFNNWERYGTNKYTWEFDSRERWIQRENNDYWSGFYDPNFDSSQYTLEVEMATFDGDNDDIGITFGMDGGEIGSYAYILSGAYRSFDYGSDRTNQHGHATGLYTYNGSTINGIESDNRIEFDNYDWHDVKLEVNGSNIKIWVDGSLRINRDMGHEVDGSYGFFTNSQPHGTFRNLKVTSEVSKEFTEVIRQPEWREGSDRYIVNVSDKEVNEFNNSAKTSEMLTRLLNEGTHFLAVGNNQNESQMESFIRKNDGNGEFFEGSYNSYMEGIADYIESKIERQSGTDEVYVLKDEPVDIEVLPESLRNNTATSEYPEGRWRVEHVYDFFDNDIGQAQWANQWQEDLRLTFDKPGRYELFFEDDTIEPRYVYVHRKPVVQFGVFLSRSGDNYYVDVTNNSYDLDHSESRADDGIVEVEWKWQKVSEGVWRDGKIPRNLQKNTDYIVQLRVKDVEGVWSDRESKYISTSDIASTPVASFSFEKNPVSKHEGLNINDTSYDPAGATINRREWIVERSNGSVIYSSTVEPSNILGWSAGSYIVKERVRNSDGNWSEFYSRPLTVTDDNLSPEMLVNPASKPWTVEDIEVDVSFTDPGGSGFDKQRYAVTESASVPNNGWSSYSSSTNRNVKMSGNGEYYLHVEALDNAGNKSVRSTGPYQIDRVKPNKPEITLSSGEWEDNVSYSISSQGDEGSGVDRVEYKLRGENEWTVDDQLTKMIPGDLKGEVDVWARVVDNVGNVSNVTHVVAKIDDKAPVVYDVSLERDYDSGRLTVHAEDKESGIDGYRYWLDMVGDNKGFELVTDWKSESEYMFDDLEANKVYKMKAELRDSNDNRVETEVKEMVTSVDLSFSGKQEGDFKNTLRFEWDTEIEVKYETKLEVYREDRLWRTFVSGKEMVDENLDYERSYDYRFVTVHGEGEERMESKPVRETLDIGLPEVEFEADQETFEYTPFADEVEISGIVRFRQGSDVRISVAGMEQVVNVSPYETVRWAFSVPVSDVGENEDVSVRVLDESFTTEKTVSVETKKKGIQKDSSWVK